MSYQDDEFYSFSMHGVLRSMFLPMYKACIDKNLYVDIMKPIEIANILVGKIIRVFLKDHLCELH